MGAPDPLKGGSVTLNLKLPKNVKVTKPGGGAVKSGKKTVTLPIGDPGGSLDPTNGTGPVQPGGSFKLKKGKKKVTISEIKTTFGSTYGGGNISAKVGKKTKTLADLTGGAVGRNGFGGTVTGATSKTAKGGAKSLNKALGLKKKKKFKKGKSLGTASTETVPKTVGIVVATAITTEASVTDGGAACLPAGNCPFAVITAIDGIQATTSNGAVLDTSNLAAPRLIFPPKTSGDIAPDCTAGELNGGGALTLSRSTPTAGTLVQQNPTDNFTAKQVIFQAFASKLGDLGRAAATDLDMSTATCVADAATKTVKITGVTERANAAAASIGNLEFDLNGSYPSCAGSQSCPIFPGTLIGKTDFVITTH
jgi:hypothetical protein